jgi:hypothetical protein
MTIVNIIIISIINIIYFYPIKITVQFVGEGGCPYSS